MKMILSLLIALATIQVVVAQSAKLMPDDHTLMRFLENQEYARAAEYLKIATAADRENMHYLSLLGYVYYMSHQLSLAEACYGKIFTKDSFNAAACNYLGNINWQKGNKLHALYFFCRLVDLKPGVAGYYKQLAALWQQLRNRAAATYYYRLAYFINPNDAGVIVGLADGWIEQKIYARADSIMNAALQKDSLQEGILETRIHSAYLQENYKDIFPMVNKLKEMGAITMNPFFYAAAGYYLTKQYRKCTAVCDFMIVNGLKTRSVLYLEAMAFEKEKKYKLSLAMLDECLADALSKDAVTYFSSKGEIYEKIHQYYSALKQYDTAYYIFHAPLALYKKALVYDRDIKKTSTALKYYSAYLHQRRDSVPEAEKQVFQYVVQRVKALKKWKAAK